MDSQIVRSEKPQKSLAIKRPKKRDSGRWHDRSSAKNWPKIRKNRPFFAEIQHIFSTIPTVDSQIVRSEKPQKSLAQKNALKSEIMAIHDGKIF